MANHMFQVQIKGSRLMELIAKRCGGLEKDRGEALEREQAALKAHNAHDASAAHRTVESINRTIESLQLVHQIVSESGVGTYDLTLEDLKLLDLFQTDRYCC